MKTTLIIFTLNEIEGVNKIFPLIPFSCFDECFVIDGGSTDGTIEFFQEKNIPVVRQQKPGRGQAFFEAARIAEGDILFFFSPDGNEEPADLLKLLSAMKNGGDMAIASRAMKGGQFEKENFFIPYRAWANRIFSFLANLFFRGRVSDAINGFRAIRKDRFFDLKLNAEHFAIEYQMSIRAMKKKYNIMEAATIEGERMGKSKAKSLPVGLDLLGTLVKEFFL